MAATPTTPRTTPSPSEILAKAVKRRITDAEQRRLYEAERRGEKPLISQQAYTPR